MREPKEMERLRFAETPSVTVRNRGPAKLDEPRLVGMKVQSKASEPRLEICKELLCLVPVLETDDRVVCILRGPAPSLHGLRGGRNRLVRPLPCYFAQVRLLHRTHRRLRPLAFPPTSRPRLAGKAMEISRFPCKRLLRMPGSTTTRGQHASCDIDTRRVAFCGTENIGTPNLAYAAQYLACALPCERFASALAGNRASLGAGVVRYAFTVTDFHRLPSAGLPAHPSTASLASRSTRRLLTGQRLSPVGFGMAVQINA